MFWRCQCTTVFWQFLYAIACVQLFLKFRWSRWKFIYIYICIIHLISLPSSDRKYKPFPLFSFFFRGCMSNEAVLSYSISYHIYIYIYIYMGASHTLHSLTAIGFMPIANRQLSGHLGNPIYSYRVISDFGSITTVPSLMRANTRIYQGLKIVFFVCKLHYMTFIDMQTYRKT